MQFPLHRGDISTVPESASGSAAGLDPRTIGRLARRAMADMGEGIAYGDKVVLQPHDDELAVLLGRSAAESCPGNQRLNWKLNALVSANARYCAVKIVGSNACNHALGLPRSQSQLILYDKLTMTPLAQFDGTAVSAGRTGAYASIAVDLLLAHGERLSICLYGAGPIADCVVDDLHAHHAHRINRIHVCSRRPPSAQAFAAAAAARTGLDVRSGDDDPGHVDLVITATNAGSPIVPVDRLHPDVAVLHLGGDELPVSFIEAVLARGSVICDDVASVCHRNSQSLPLYFSRQNLRLSDLGGLFRIRSLHDRTLGNGAVLARPALMTCVGLPVLDLYLAQWLYEQGAAAAGTAHTTAPPPPPGRA